MRLNCKIAAVQKIINNKINNKIRLILNKAYFHTKAEERSGKKNYVIFITKKIYKFWSLVRLMRLSCKIAAVQKIRNEEKKPKLKLSKS